MCTSRLRVPASVFIITTWKGPQRCLQTYDLTYKSYRCLSMPIRETKSLQHVVTEVHERNKQTQIYPRNPA